MWVVHLDNWTAPAGYAILLDEYLVASIRTCVQLASLCDDLTHTNAAHVTK